MPENKDAYSRYRIIDECLRKWRPIKTASLTEVCSDRLGKRIAVRTIQKDIEDMKEDNGLKMYAPIKYDKAKKAYFYEKGTGPILLPRINLTEEEVMALLFYLKASNHYKEYKIFNKISDAIEKVLGATKISDDLKNAFKTDTILETEKILPLKGSEHLYQLIFAVRERRIIAFDYLRFEEDVPKRRILQPLLLKEVSQMWYVIGLEKGRESPATFAIDRMRNLDVSTDLFTPVAFSSSDHFKDSLGITVSESDPIKVVLQFSKRQGNYIKALPIHESQKIEHDNLLGLRISIKVKPSYELFSRILGYGQDVKVISPNALKGQIKRILRETLNKY